MDASHELGLPIFIADDVVGLEAIECSCATGARRCARVRGWTSTAGQSGNARGSGFRLAAENFAAGW